MPLVCTYTEAVPLRVKVLYFAGLKDLLGRSEEALELENVSTVGEVTARLARTYPELAGRLGCVRVAVNESFADSQELVKDGDVVALIPPVSGG
jgi:molybdopterin synthase sulfur carrier subunit